LSGRRRETTSDGRTRNATQVGRRGGAPMTEREKYLFDIQGYLLVATS
jgi:hypothetical protein